MSKRQPSAPVENLRKAIQIAKQKKEESLFVFDMDSTLFCMKYRTQAIIRDCLKDPLFCETFSEYLSAIRQVRVTARDWSVEEIMSRYGFLKEAPLVLAVQKIWRKNFFANTYLHLDKPYKGAASFVRHISQLGAQVYYLTARNQAAMREGTVQSLKFWSFPLKDEKRLIMKEDSEAEDAAYKMERLKKLAQKSDAVLYFENEPVALNRAVQSIPQALLFWINSVHSRREKPPPSALPLSMNYVW